MPRAYTVVLVIRGSEARKRVYVQTPNFPEPSEVTHFACFRSLGSRSSSLGTAPASRTTLLRSKYYVLIEPPPNLYVGAFAAFN